MPGLRKILLVDDDDDLREALSEQLVMTEDFDVFEAGTGAEGRAERVPEVQRRVVDRRRERLQRRPRPDPGWRASL